MSASSQYLQALVGTTVGNSYVLDRVLGQGRHGALLDARNVRLGQRCIVRMLRADASRRQALITALAQHGGLSHPYLHPPRDVIVLPDDQLLLASPLLVGQDLNQRIAAGGKLSASEGVLMMRQACSGLHALHQKGLVHGNLTASNVFFTRYDDVAVDNPLSDSKGSNIVQLIDAGLHILDGQNATPADDQRALGRMVQAFVSDLTAAQRKVLERSQEARPEARYPSIAELWRAFEAATGPAAGGARGGASGQQKAGSIATTMVPQIRRPTRRAHLRLYGIVGAVVLVLGTLGVIVIGMTSRRKPPPPATSPISKDETAPGKKPVPPSIPASDKANEENGGSEEPSETDGTDKTTKSKKKKKAKTRKKSDG